MLVTEHDFKNIRTSTVRKHMWLTKILRSLMYSSNVNNIQNWNGKHYIRQNKISQNLSLAKLHAFLDTQTQLYLRNYVCTSTSLKVQYSFYVSEVKCHSVTYFTNVPWQKNYKPRVQIMINKDSTVFCCCQTLGVSSCVFSKRKMKNLKTKMPNKFNM